MPIVRCSDDGVGVREGWGLRMRKLSAMTKGMVVWTSMHPAIAECEAISKPLLSTAFFPINREE